MSFYRALWAKYPALACYFSSKLLLGLRYFLNLLYRALIKYSSIRNISILLVLVGISNGILE